MGTLVSPAWIAGIVLDHGKNAAPAASLELIAMSSLGFLVLITAGWYLANRYT